MWAGPDGVKNQLVIQLSEDTHTCTQCLIKLESCCYPQTLLVRTGAQGHGRVLANRRELRQCVCECARACVCVSDSRGLIATLVIQDWVSSGALLGSERNSK